jgi:DNA mismatch repair protein MLH3
MHKSAIVSRQTPAPPQLHLTLFSHGTRVTVRDLFGNMPVRVKQRAMSAEKPRGNSKEWEELRRGVVLLLLAWPRTVGVTIHEAGTNEKLLIRGRMAPSASVSLNLVDISAVCSILSQASLISIDEKSFWVPAQASTSKMTICATISLIPSATKQTQFISFGIQPLVSHNTRSILHDEINRMFLNSTFGNDDEDVELDASEIDRRSKDKRYKRDGFTNKELRGGKKGIDRWPMFYLNIYQDNQAPDARSLGIDDILDDRGGSLTTIVEILQVMIWEFLTKHRFRPKFGRGQRIKITANAGHANAQNLEGSKTPTKSTTSIVPEFELDKAQREGSIPRPFHSDSAARKVKARSPQLVSPRLDAPFDLWTRIKSGSRPTKLAEQVRIPNPAHLHRPLSAPPSSTNGRSSRMVDPVDRSVTPLLSSKGKLIRRPFQDVAVSAAKSRTQIAKAPQSRENSSEPGEDVIAWINPFTKVESLINQRTGLTVRADAPNSTRSNAASSSLIYKQPMLPRLIKSNVEEPSPWLNNILRTWNNPVFCPTEPSIPQITLEGQEAGVQEILHGRRHHCSQIDIDRAFKEPSAGIDGRISKTALSHAEVISQVDKKFILVTLEHMKCASAPGGGKLLVLIDQHAADERVRIESLLEEFFAPAADASVPTDSGVRTNPLNKPINFEVSVKESRLLHKYKEHFIRWGIIFDLSPDAATPEKPSTSTDLRRLAVRSLPPGIVERCKLDPKLLIDLIRTEAWKVHDDGTYGALAIKGDWLERIHACPRGIIDMLNSRACRSAIMFNDELSKQQCEALVSKLAKCKFPFQCAHGRPSLVPLVDLRRMEIRTAKPLTGGHRTESTFGAGFNKWKESIK